MAFGKLGALGARGGFGSLGGLGGVSIPAHAPVDAFFAASSYVGGTLASMASNTNSTGGYAYNSDGTISLIAANLLRIGTLGLLREPAATKLALQSNAFTTTPWTAANSTTAAPVVTPNTTVSPDGATNAATIAYPAFSGAGSTTNFTQLQQLVPVTANATVHTASIWLKGAVGGETVYIIPQQNGGDFHSLGAVACLLTTSWQRFFCTFTTTTGGSTYLSLGYNGIDSGIPNGPAYTIRAYAFELEAGSVATSPWITTTVTRTRSADAVVWSGALATAFAQSTASIIVTTNQLQQATANTFINANGTDLIGKLSSDKATTAVGAVLSTSLTGTWSGPATVSLAWDGTGGALQLNSGTVVTDATARTPSAPFTMGDAAFIGIIARIQGYNTKLALSAAASIPITSLTFGTVFKYNSGYPTKYVNSDVWANTWADDDTIYTASDDGQRWSAATPTSNFMISSLDGFTTALTGTLVNGMVTDFGIQGQLGSDGANFKACGMASINGTLYCFVARQTYGTAGSNWIQTSANAQLIKSSDHGANFSPLPPSQGQPYASPMFPNSRFAAPYFIQYGKDYTGNTVHNSNQYVYATSVDGVWNNGNAVYLGRCKISEISLLDATKWSYWVSGDGMLDANWTSSVASANPIMSGTRLFSMNPANYIPSCGRYLYINWYYPKITDLTLTGYQAQTIWTVYEAPAPWGPWTQVQSKTWNVAGALGLYNPNIIHKSISTDNGHTVMIATTGDFANQNNQTGDYTLHLVPGVVNN